MNTPPTGDDVSVVVPTWNGSRFIEEALDSVRGQSVLPRELIIVDDGSTDGTAKVVQAWASRHPEIAVRVHLQANRGPGGATNTGIQLADASLIATLDHDDIWQSEHLKLALEAFDRVKGLGLYFADQVGVKEGRVEYQSFLEGSRAQLVPSTTVKDDLELFSVRPFQWLVHGSFVCSSTAVFRRDGASDIGGFTTDFPFVDDRDFFLRLTMDRKVAVRWRVVNRYRIHDRNLSAASNALPLARDRFLLLERYVKGWAGPPLAPEELTQLQQAFLQQAVAFHRAAAEGARTVLLSALRTLAQSSARRILIRPKVLAKTVRGLVRGHPEARAT